MPNSSGRSEWPKSQSRYTSPARSVRPASEDALGPEHLARLRQYGERWGEQWAEANSELGQRDAMTTSLGCLTGFTSPEQRQVRIAALSAFDKVVQRKEGKAQADGMRLGQGWALHYALSGVSVELQRQSLREELARRTTSSPDRYIPILEQAAWRGYEAALNSMNRTAARSRFG